jgi:HD-GYP domain-containing protein (c-di-GMP phosphodiesterase class II)
VAVRLLEHFDSETGERTSLDRLELVMSAFAEALNAAAWTISFAGPEAGSVRTISTADDRDSRLQGIRVGLDSEIYDLDDYPLTGRLVANGGGSFLVDTGDRDCDAAVRTLLAELGFTAVLCVAVRDLDGIWLAELYGDPDTGDLALADLRLQLVARAAAGRSPSAVERMALLDKRGRHLAVTGSIGACLATLSEETEIACAAAEQLYDEFGCEVSTVVKLVPGNQAVAVAGKGPAAAALIEQGWRQPAGLGIVGRALREQAIVVVDDVRAEPDYRESGVAHDVRSELCAPLWAGDELWGALDLESVEVGAFDEDDVQLVRTVADQVSAALRSARLYERIECAYLDTARALCAALEAKDSYTAGHSRSIAEHAETVGEALGMDSDELRRLRFGAALHDIGKLAVPEHILNKPGRLDPEERAQIERHTVIGDEILAPIDFLADVRPLVRACHERWDGGGYPDGLAGEEIPLGARIIFACDAFDAMTTDRPYRAALDRAEALAELRRGAGTEFDPRVVDALLGVLDGAA